MNPIYTNDPVFVRRYQDGAGNEAALYTAGEGDDKFSIVHIWADTDYNRGYVHGKLMEEDLKNFFGKVYAYFEDQFIEAITDAVEWIPEKWAQHVADSGLAVGLDLTYQVTRMYTGKYFFDEMHGIADASGFDYETIRRIHMIGELTKASCSMYGAWGNATKDGKSLQMRALDWSTDGPFQDFP